uniref:Uncharacterized protein n=1 Tax=Ditylenchus dipsaci TaxID=166011 RepID=A0A915E5C2_9BILA
MWLDSHRHIFSEPVEQKKMVDDPSVLQLLMTNDDKKAAISKAIENCEAKKKQYEDEQKRINEIAARFGLFLRRNAIVAYNDAVKSYIQMSIRLKRALADYEAQKQLITRDCGDSGVNGLADIKIVYDELVNLSLTGSNIKQLFDAENLDRQKDLSIPKISSRRSGSSRSLHIHPFHHHLRRRPHLSRRLRKSFFFEATNFCASFGVPCEG